MKANELAKKLEEYSNVNFFIDCTYEQYDEDRIFKIKAATMLRQQQAELTEAGHMIGVLREYISDLEKGLDSSINLNKAQAERNNKPVAWIPVKELTDEEIWQIYADNLSFRVCKNEDAINLIYCARAILRKAQEK